MSSEQNEQEIVLDSVPGLEDFIAYVSEQYGDFKTIAEELTDEPATHVFVRAGEEAYKRLADAVADAFTALEREEELTEELVERIQDAYNDFIRSFEQLASEEETLAEAAALTEAAAKEEQSEPVPEKVFPEKELGPDAIVQPHLTEHPDYALIIDTHYGSPSAFESSLWRLVKHVEEPQQLDRFFGISHGSIFKEVLRGQTVGEIDFFNKQPGGKIREVLQIMELEDGVVYDYRTFVRWMNEFAVMKELVTPDNDMLFDDLMARAELEAYLR